MNITELAKQASMNRERCYDMDEFLVLYTKLVLEEAAKVVETTPWSNWFQGDCVAGIRNLIK